MGYTHRWVVKDRLSAQTPIIAQDAQTLAAACGFAVSHSFDEPERAPTFGPGYIQFNARVNAYEDFRYPPNWSSNADVGLPAGFGWCKTELQPYDTLVAATVLAIKHHLENDVVANSDGPPDSPAWTKAIDLYTRTFPERTVPVLDNWPTGSERED